MTCKAPASFLLLAAAALLAPSYRFAVSQTASADPDDASRGQGSP